MPPPRSKRKGEGGRGKGEGGRRRRGEVPRSLGDVLDDKRGMRGDNSWRRRRDVQNIEMICLVFGVDFGVPCSVFV